MKVENIGRCIQLSDDVMRQEIARFCRYNTRPIARLDLVAKRRNGNKNDLEESQSKKLPGDGKYERIKGKLRDNGLVYGQERPDGSYEYEIEYHAGPKDKEWFCQVDCNYLSRLVREGNLQTKEPDVWALRELDRARGERVDDIGAWWRTKVFLPNIGELLETAQSIFVGKLLKADLIKCLPTGSKSFEQGLLNIIRGYLGLKIIRPNVERKICLRLSVSRVPASKRGLFSREHYERKDAEAEEAAEISPRL